MVVFKSHESKDNSTMENYQVLVTIFGESEILNY